MSDSGSVTKQDLWQNWVLKQVDTKNPVPLFDTDENLEVNTRSYGNNSRPVLKRHSRMEEMIRTEGQKVVDDYSARGGTYEGLIYIMYTLEDEEVIPYYIGKCGKHKRNSDELNSNLENISTNDLKLARWGYGRYYHLGNLSAAVLDYDSLSRVDRTGVSGKFERWAKILFEPGTKHLKKPVYLSVKAWSTDDVGPYVDIHPYLAELEYQLIGFAYELYPETLLNTEGVPNNPEAHAKMRGWIEDGRTELADF